MTVDQIVSELVRLRPLLTLGATHYQAGKMFLALKASVRHGQFEKLAVRSGYTRGHWQKLMSIARGVDALGIRPDQVKDMTFDQLYEAARVGKKTPGNLEAYWTPSELARVLLTREKFPGPVWEPAVGSGRIAAALTAFGHSVIPTDVKDYEFPGTSALDFLTDDPPEFRSIVTNPPFQPVLKWVRRCLELKPDKFAILALPAVLGDYSKLLPGSGYSLTRLTLIPHPPPFIGPSGKFAPPWGVCWFVAERGIRKGIVESVQVGA